MFSITLKKKKKKLKHLGEGVPNALRIWRTEGNVWRHSVEFILSVIMITANMDGTNPISIWVLTVHSLHMK